MRRIKLLKIFLLPVLLFAFISMSCEKIINIDLNRVDPRLVIEGKITDQPGPYTVKISQTTDYYYPGEMPRISGARVIISDNHNTQEVLTEIEPGTYQTDSLQGIPGRTYSLHVEISGKVYISESTMPLVVEIDSLYYTSRAFGFHGENKQRFELSCVFRDDPDRVNYCNFRVFRNGIPVSRYFLYSDRLSNGNVITYKRFRTREYERNDFVKVSLLSIDQATYEYYSTLNDVLATDPRGPASTSVPANPNSNISGNALGYFGAYTVRSDSILLK
jgi:hypothetical protein